MPELDPNMTVKEQVLTILAERPGLSTNEVEPLIVGKSEKRPWARGTCIALWQEGRLRREEIGGVFRYFLLDQNPASQAQSGKGPRWSPEELLVAVEAYWRMLQMELRGEPFSKMAVLRQLHETSLLNRSLKSIELRMQNISAVLAATERPFIWGYKPADHVGPGPTKHILKFLAELDGTLPDVLRDLPEPQLEPPVGRAQPQRVERQTVVFQRDPAVVAWVLKRANGFCECCRTEAPFLCVDGLPFLEVHHVTPLSAGGADTVQNAVALCPNCHREAHYGMNADGIARRLEEHLNALVLPADGSGKSGEKS